MLNIGCKKYINVIFALLSLLITPCFSQEININTEKQKILVVEQKIVESKNLVKTKLTVEENQDALRVLLLNSKQNSNLKASILQELYLRGLVEQVNDKIKFRLPFNLHGVDCGAPDCYSTDIIFEISAKVPIEFPKKINFNLVEHGCIDKEILDD